ncbi:MAG: L-fucose/L-arabinose isomerase family protein [Anaerolineales bacterium]|jgi:L-fucose isomerase-like protein
MTNPRVAFVPIARQTFDIEFARQNSDSAREQVRQLPLEVVGPADLVTDQESAEILADSLSKNPPDLLVIFQATFADSSMLMSLIARLDAPILLWAVPENHTGGRLRLNSLCGINLAAHALTRAGYQYQHIYTHPDDPAALSKITTLAKAGRARNALRTARVGRIGENPDGFETCLSDPDHLRETFGLELVQFDLINEFFPLTDQIKADNITSIEQDLTHRVTGIEQLDSQAVRKTLGSYAALKQLAQEKDLHGFALRCWPEFFTQKGCAACGAVSMLSDEMIPSSCETDVNGTITQLILQSISHEPAFGTDIVSLDEERDALVVWHCGNAPLSMADPEAPVGTTIHSNRKLPLLFEFTLKPGPVTIARLTESTGDYRLVLGRGEIIRGPKSFSGTSGLLKFSRPARDVLDTILSEGLEHHISLTYGDHIEVLTSFAQLEGIEILHLTQ